MAEHRKDAEDLRLEALFGSEPIADDGFSARVVTRVRRKVLVQRFALPVAAILGLLISAGPVMELVQIVPGLFDSMFGNLLPEISMPTFSAAQVSLFFVGAAISMVFFLASQLLEE